MSATRAVVLSAGQGRRLLPLTETRPKCLIEFAGRTLLAWQLERLAAAGITEFVVVTGFGAELVEREIGRFVRPGVTVRPLYNPFYGVADNLASCWIARAAFDCDVVLLNGDTLFEAKIAERLLAAPPADIVVTVDRKPSYDQDDMKVLTRGDALLSIGKTIETYDAESIGLLRFSPQGAARFRDALELAMRRPEGLRRWYLSVIDELARQDGGVAVRSIEGLGWREVDFPADLVGAEEMTRRWAEA